MSARKPSLLERLPRPLRSVLDYIAFFEINLSDRPRLYVLALLIPVVLAALGSVIAPRDWGALAWLPLGIMALGLLCKLAAALWHPGRAPDYSLQEAADFKALVDHSVPSARDVHNGWRAVAPAALVQGGVHLSAQFNHRCMSNPAWDVPLRTLSDGTHYAGILRNIRQHRGAFRQIGGQMVLKKLFDGKALTNERKIGIACDFHDEIQEVTLFKSSYLATWCSGDLAHKNIVAEGPNGRRMHSLARERAPFETQSAPIVLRPLSVCAQTISTQIGINLLGITRDDVLLIAIQGKKTMVGQNARVPLATGSMDWEDREAARTLKEVGQIAALRELREEWGQKKILSKTRPLEMDQFLPLGIYRVPGRSGKPEFAAIARLNWNEQDLIPDTSEVNRWEDQPGLDQLSHRHPVPRFEDLERAVEQLLDQTGSVEDSAPLFGVLLCLQDLLQRDPKRVAEGLGYARAPSQPVLGEV